MEALHELLADYANVGNSCCCYRLSGETEAAVANEYWKSGCCNSKR